MYFESFHDIYDSCLPQNVMIKTVIKITRHKITRMHINLSIPGLQLPKIVLI